jgi:hypothetical protein
MWLGPRWWGDCNLEGLFSSSFGLGHRWQTGQNEGERTLSPGKDFLIGTLINRNTPSIGDHMFFFQMGTSTSRIPEGSLLACLLKCWKDINPDNLHKKALIFLHSGLVPIFPWRSGKWPEGGTLNYDIIPQLDLFCKKEGKCTEILHVQLFFFLKKQLQWVEQCKGGAQTLTIVCKNILKEGDTSKTPLVTPKKATSPTLPKGSEESGYPAPTAPLPPWPVAATPSNLFPGGGAAA